MAWTSASIEQRRPEWSDIWWGVDFSWAGLATKPIRGGGPNGEQTLQDYWRRDPATGAVRNDAAMRAAGEVVDGPDGRAWHVVHMPTQSRDGQSSWKADQTDQRWTGLESLLALRFGVSVPTATTNSSDATGQDGRAQLSGAVLRQLPPHPAGPTAAIHVCAQQAIFLSLLDCSSFVFGGGASFYRSLFASFADFVGARFLGSASFERASFTDRADFEDAEFHGAAIFLSTLFAGDAAFSNARFDAAGASYFDATFTGDAGFDGATFAGQALFKRSFFLADASFHGATFDQEAKFEFATFRKDAWFTALQESDSKPASFSGLASFDSAVFEAPARFEGAVFKSRLSFDTARFRLIADFSGVTLPDIEDNWRSAFDGALFEASLDIRGAPDKAISLVAGATFDRGVLLERVSEKDEVAAHNEALKLACKAEDRDVALRALESGALKLKLAMEQESDIARALRFYRLELRARRKQTGTKWTEKFVSGIYSAVSRYGGSLGWPFVWLAGAILVFALAYWSLEGRWRSDSAALVEAGRYSLSRVFPLGTWDEGPEPVRVTMTGVGDTPPLNAIPPRPDNCTFRERLLAVGECRPRGTAASELDSPVELELHRTAMAGLSVLQTVAAGILYFLLALAVRRRFQIS